MEQQLVVAEEEEVNLSVDAGAFSKPDDRGGAEEKRDSELESRPSTSSEDGM